MAEFRDRDLFLVKKALAIAILAIERQPGALQPASDCQDMKTILGELVGNPAELAQLMRSARIAVTGQPE
ncbi:hypothetical protein [Halodurantibacterium flavum]|uniref:Uncharacterized protein n=1 Tax=Halodurantibacterium flavum TaxID=1382802 RepID=A0ABW4S153_9RHOB